MVVSTLYEITSLEMKYSTFTWLIILTGSKAHVTGTSKTTWYVETSTMLTEVRVQWTFINIWKNTDEEKIMKFYGIKFQIPTLSQKQPEVSCVFLFHCIIQPLLKMLIIFKISETVFDKSTCIYSTEHHKIAILTDLKRNGNGSFFTSFRSGVGMETQWKQNGIGTKYKNC